MKRSRILFCILALVGMASCAASRSLIVLLPDPDGHVGTIRVETNKGFIAVDKSYQAVAIITRQAPESLSGMTRKQVEVKFERALDVEPAQRFRFSKQAFYCRRNSTELVPESVAELSKTILQMNAQPPLEIYVVGHADRVGTEKYNHQLSRKRAQALEQELVAGGINSKIILVSYLGESNPQIDTPDEVEEPRNRRVELILKHARS